MNWEDQLDFLKDMLHHRSKPMEYAWGNKHEEIAIQFYKEKLAKGELELLPKEQILSAAPVFNNDDIHRQPRFTETGMIEIKCERVSKQLNWNSSADSDDE